VTEVTRPLVSVIIPVHNAAPFIAEALASVLTQRYRRIEVIVVDDGSTDGSAGIALRVTDERCRILHQAQHGAAAARNLGIAASTGALLAFLDADDVWPAAKLEVQVRALDADPGLDMVFGHYLPLTERNDIPADARPLPGYSLGTLLIRRHSFASVGPLSTSWRVGEFIDWYARAEEQGLRHAMLPDVLLERRVHAASLTASLREARGDYARVVRAMAVRRARLRSSHS
jgi:glycosyltransferase involved in cell wall biosynthesis